MIIYGSRVVHLKSKKSKSGICPSCATKGTIILNLFRKHVHIFWIPIFPIGKKGIAECENCSNILEIKVLPDSLKREYQDLKFDVRGPIWQFSGLFIIVFLFTLGYFQNKQDTILEKEYINAPVIGDVYEYKLETGYYSTLKVSKVTNDSIFVVPNNYEISKVSRIYKIEKEENYLVDNTYGISRDHLQIMYSKGEIIDINR